MRSTIELTCRSAGSEGLAVFSMTNSELDATLYVAWDSHRELSGTAGARRRLRSALSLFEVVHLNPSGPSHTSAPTFW